MVQTLLDFVRSTRAGDWDLYLQSTERMLKWFHGYDHMNYSRHFTYFWVTQQVIEQTIKDQKGKFSMYFSDR